MEETVIVAKGQTLNKFTVTGGCEVCKEKRGFQCTQSTRLDLAPRLQKHFCALKEE